ncbi:unnamed protein product [Prorocentrum cordatum]|uniref:Phospholipase B-like n=1 Tax=Prorocentrum cordatum TaxID=2364126 RepID=A0ABN9RPS7_9DINO|nr:unnamed protein product [Polarella glacialis]
MFFSAAALAGSAMPRLACSPGMGRRATRPYTFPWCHASALLLIASLAPTGQHAPDCARGAVGPVWGGLALAQRQKLASRLAESRRVTAGGGEKEDEEGEEYKKEGDWRESSCYSPWPPLVWEQGEPAAKEHGSLSDRDACRAMHSVRAHCWRGWTANVRSELESSSAERDLPSLGRPFPDAHRWSTPRKHAHVRAMPRGEHLLSRCAPCAPLHPGRDCWRGRAGHRVVDAMTMDTLTILSLS